MSGGNLLQQLHCGRHLDLRQRMLQVVRVNVHFYCNVIDNLVAR